MYLVCFVVVLWIVFEDLFLFFVVEVVWQSIHILVLSPFLAIHKPIKQPD